MGRTAAAHLFQPVQAERLEALRREVDAAQARFRHPIYAAVWMTGLAQVLMLANFIAGPACLALFLPVNVVRVPREERMMRDHFGDAYQAYMNRTGAVIPRLGNSSGR